jgi:type VI secretion system protein
MAIKLRVISNQYRELGEHRARVFGVNGGTIGRAPDNDWVLPDPKRLVSGHHCEITYRGGNYWLKDTSTNGVYVNDAEEPVASGSPVPLQDGDRLRLGDYELIVGIDERMDFLPSAAEQRSAEQHMDSGIISAKLDVNSLFVQRDPAESGSVSIRNAFGIKLGKSGPEIPIEAPPPPVARPRPVAVAAVESAAPAPGPSPAPAAVASAGPAATESAPLAATADWALKTRAITRQELADALARRQSRLEARPQTLPFHQQATTWEDLRGAVQAFCRGAGIDPASLSPEAQSMLPLLAGQLLREAVVGLNDLQLARQAATPAAASAGAASVSASNPLRTSSSVEQALQRLFESHGRLYGGPVDALREVLQEVRDHEAAMNAAIRAGTQALLEQLSPGNVADQFEQGRARTLAPGQDPRPRYWEYYAEFYRVIAQSASDGVPHPFAEAFTKAYEETRAGLRTKRKGREA